MRRAKPYNQENWKYKSGDMIRGSWRIKLSQSQELKQGLGAERTTGVSVLANATNVWRVLRSMLDMCVCSSSSVNVMMSLNDSNTWPWPVWLWLSQELPLLQWTSTDTELLHHSLGRTAVTQHLSQDHLEEGVGKSLDNESTKPDWNVRPFSKTNSYFPKPTISNLLKVV